MGCSELFVFMDQDLGLEYVGQVLSMLVMSGSLTRLKFGIAEYLSVGLLKAKMLLENSTYKRKSKLQVQIERLSKENVSKKKGYC